LHGHFIGHFTPPSHTLNHYKIKPKGDIDGAIAAAEAQMAKGERLNLTKTAGELGLREARFLVESPEKQGLARSTSPKIFNTSPTARRKL
jgi:hypothetical protein